MSIHVRQCAQDDRGVDVVLEAESLAVTNGPNVYLGQVPPSAALGPADRTQKHDDSLPCIEVLLLLAAWFDDLIGDYREELAEPVVAAEGASPRQRLGASPLDLWVEELKHGGDIDGFVEATNHRNIRLGLVRHCRGLR